MSSQFDPLTREILIRGYEAIIAMQSANPLGGPVAVMLTLAQMPPEIREAIYQRHADKTASNSST